MVEDRKQKSMWTGDAAPEELEVGVEQEIDSGGSCRSGLKREKKWRLGVISACILGIIVILIIALVLQITGRI